MCIAVPREVLAVDELTATVAGDAGPEQVRLCLMSEPVAVGDWLTVQAGRYAVGRMDASEARERIALIESVLGPSPATRMVTP